MGSFSKGLRALGESITPSREDVEAMGFLDPRLRTCYSPRVSWEWSRPEDPAEDRERSWARVWDWGPLGDPMGLSIAPNSKRPARYGLKGMPANGRKEVSRALALLEENRPCLSFWTVSLPTEALLALARSDRWAQFQDRLRKELIRKLRSAGLPGLAVGVAELQPRRSLAAGMPCPHLHVVFQGRKTRGHAWALSRADLDGVIAAALATAGVHAPDGIEASDWLACAGNVQQVKKSVRAYLAKYMTKGSDDTSEWIGHPAESLIPRQWWFWGRDLRNWVREHIFPIAFTFLLWVHTHRVELEQLGLARFRILPLEDPRAPITYEVNWLSSEHLARLVSLWQVDCWDEEWHRGVRLSQSGLT